MKIERIDHLRNFWKTASNSYLSLAISDFVKLVDNRIEYALCGGLVVGLYGRARGTDDIDILIKNESDIEIIIGLVGNIFKRHRKHAIIHIRTGVEIELLTSDFINVDSSIVNVAIDNAVIKSVGNINIPVITKEFLVILKLQRANEYDIGDIKNILRNNTIDLSKFNYGKEELFERIVNEVKNESRKDDSL